MQIEVFLYASQFYLLNKSQTWNNPSGIIKIILSQEKPRQLKSIIYSFWLVSTLRLTAEQVNPNVCPYLAIYIPARIIKKIYQ